MKLYSTTQAAKQLGITPKSLSRYIAAKKVPAPKVLESGKIIHHVWTEEEVENLRQLLPKIANGRKTRYKKKHSAVSTQHSAKTNSTGKSSHPAQNAAPGRAALRTTRRSNKPQPIGQRPVRHTERALTAVHLLWRQADHGCS